MFGYKLKLAKMETFNLTNIKTWNSRNGYGMSATLLIDQKAACSLYDIGDGSQPDVEVISPELYNKLTSKLETLPEMEVMGDGYMVKIDVPMFIDLLHYALESKTPFNLLSN